MITAIRFFVVSLYGAFCFLLGWFICLLRPFHQDNNWLICQLLGPIGFKILGLKFKASHRQRLFEIRPAVVISNHQNNLDMFPGAMMCPKGMAILGKKSIKWIPFFGQFFWLAGNLFIDRGNPMKSKRAMGELAAKMKEGKRSVWVMPEGTRSKGKGMLPFKKGAFHTAKNANVPILPVVFSSYHNRFNFNRWKSGLILTSVLDPVDTQDKTVEELRDLCQNLMKAELERLDEQVDQWLKTGKLD